jgi:hypothetical protein
MMRSRGCGRTAQCVIVSLIASVLLAAAPSLAGTFVFAGESNGTDLITHPEAYTGSGGLVRLGVCIHPARPHASEMVQPVLNVIDTFNAMTPQLGNLVGGVNSQVPANNIDFESVALHELGHCVGLGHVNLASESGLSADDREYTASVAGEDARYGLGAGADSVIGSGDDARGDDVNLHWFKRSDNDPFSVAGVVDQTTYARGLNALPSGDVFAANGSRALASALGLPASEAVMQQGTHAREAQRALGHDDVATLRYARAGLDELAGTEDDYTLQLEYVAYGEDCDIEYAFDDEETDFAVCQLSGAYIPGESANHTRVTSAKIYFNDAYNWHFNQEISVSSAALVPITGLPGRILLTLCLGAVVGCFAWSARSGRQG